MTALPALPRHPHPQPQSHPVAAEVTRRHPLSHPVAAEVTRRHPLFTAVVATALLLTAGCTSTSQRQASAREALIAGALTFHAGFEGTTDAGYARGDRRIQNGKQWGKPRDVVPGLPTGGAVHLDAGAGRHGGALRFEKKIPQLVAYLAEGNLAYRTNNWSGTVSFWLRVDPETDLEPGYCDTIQITSKEWNDASFFTEFTKDEKPREFRLGAYADYKVWNPKDRKWEEMSLGEKPLAPILKPPFRRDQWTHVAFTWENFNTGRPDGVTRLYLDGELAGEIPARPQTFTWDLSQVRIMLGLSYTGWMDDLAIFDRSLNAAEIQALHRLPGGVADLYR